ncbi:MAG: porin family protein [Candidatus Cloacimonetes bacterium]|nr:porin family protein [Candidatus Cloacimonadota bacterium]
MKQLILVLVLAFGINALFAQLQAQINAGLDFPGNQEWSAIDGSDDFDSYIGFSPSIEILRPVGTDVLIGGGFEFQLSRSIDAGDRNSTYAFIPIYLSAKFGFPRNGAIRPELLGNVGFNIFMADNYTYQFDTKGGMYFAFGAGIHHTKGLTVDFMYRTSKGVLDCGSYYGSSTVIDVTQTNLTLRLGYRF